MLRTLLFIIPLTFSTLHAQPELVSSALPPIGTTLTYNRGISYDVFDTTQQGQGITWDVSNLITDELYRTQEYAEPMTMYAGASFPYANYAYVGGDNWDTSYNFFLERTDTYLDLLGYWDPYTGTNVFTDPMRQLVFPITIGTQYSASNDSANISITGIGTGTLITPSGIYSNVVMIRRIHGSSYITTYYEWYSTENGAMLLQFLTTTNEWYPFDAWALTEISSAVVDLGELNDLRCVNPVEEMLEIMFSSEMNEDLDLSIIDPIGKVIRSEVINSTAGSHRSELFVGDLASGAYLLRLVRHGMPEQPRTIRFVKR